MQEVRRLAIVCAGFALAVFAAHYLLPVNYLLPLAGVFALLSAAGLAFRGRNRKRVILSLLALALGLSWYYLRYESLIAPCEALPDEPITVTARVTEYPRLGEGYSSVYLRFTDAALPRVRGVVYAYGGELDSLRPGDTLSLTLKLRAGTQRYGEYSDLNISKGLYLIGNLRGELEVTGHRESSLMYLPQELARGLQNKLREIFPEDVRGFMLALLTGDKSEYYLNESLSTAMSVSGMAHVVAVSGMHVAFLLGFLQLILGRNRRSSIICLGMIWVFVFMAGAAPSAIRAGFMQSLLLLAPLIKRVPDNQTGLALALAVILFIKPFAIGNVGLQLSFASISGIYLLAEPMNSRLTKRLNIKNRYLSRLALYAVGAFSSSVSVLILSVPILALQFGSVPILGTVANILCLWAVSAAFCVGYIACALGFVWVGFGRLFAWPAALSVRYIALIAGFAARLPFAELYTESRLSAAWIILCYVLFAVCFVFRGREKFRPLVPTALSLISLAAVLIIPRAAALRDTGTLTALDVGSGQCLVLTDKASCVVIDCGSSGTSENAGESAASFILGNGRTKIDCLLLTHLHSDHSNGVIKLMSRVKVERILLHKPTEEESEDSLYGRIMEFAGKNGAVVEFISENTQKSFGGLKLSIYSPMEKGSDNERCLMLTASVGGRNVLITGDANAEAETELVSREDVSDTDVLIVGHHGSKSSCSQELLKEAQPELAVISVGYNSYGHPTNTVLKRLKAYGAEILRTDLMGRITIR